MSTPETDALCKDLADNGFKPTEFPRSVPLVLADWIESERDRQFEQNAEQIVCIAELERERDALKSRVAELEVELLESARRHSIAKAGLENEISDLRDTLTALYARRKEQEIVPPAACVDVLTR